MKKNKKQKEWNKMKAKVDSWGDGLGYRVDPGITEAVIAWNLLSYPTSSSCEGHPYNKEGHGLPYPWIDFNVKISSLFSKERNLLEKIRKQVKSQVDNEYGKKYGNDKRIWEEKVISEWQRHVYKAIKSAQTVESKKALEKIKNANDVLGKRIKDLLKEFYKNNVSGPVSYKVSFFDNEHIVLLEPARVPKFSGKADTNLFFKETREEMSNITKFLKKKFFNS